VKSWIKNRRGFTAEAAEGAEGEERRRGEFNTKAQGHKGHKVQKR